MAKILVVDDSSFQRKWIVRAVREMGHETVEAENGETGLEKLASEELSCITIDLNMPEMSGIEFLKQMKSHNKKIPVIVITADIQTRTREECSSLGAEAFLNKPFKSTELHAVINKCLGPGGGK